MINNAFEQRIKKETDYFHVLPVILVCRKTSFSNTRIENEVKSEKERILQEMRSLFRPSKKVKQKVSHTKGAIRRNIATTDSCFVLVTLKEKSGGIPDYLA